jgi:conjugal transfer pilus assembly protein TraW
MLRSRTLVRAGGAPRPWRPGVRRTRRPHVRRGFVFAAAGLLAALGAALPAWAGDGPGDGAIRDTGALAALARQSAAILAAPPADAAAIGQAAAAAVGQAATAAASAAAASLGAAQAAIAGDTPAGSDEAAPQTRPLLLLVSASLGAQGVREALLAAAADGHTRVLLRGVLPGEPLGQGIRRLAALAASVPDSPGLEIDPPSFRAFAVTVVPAIVDPRTGAQWRGTYALASFRAALAAADGRFEAARGPTRGISEPDLAQVMQARAAALDAGRLTAAAQARFWQRVAFADLPAAQHDRVRLVDPTVRTAAPLRDQAGTVLLPASTTLNPLAQLPWRHRLVVFDPRDPGQLRWAQSLAAGDGTAVLLATAIDRDAGWDGWAALGRRLGGRVFLLPAALAQRLGLQAVPSLVELQGTGMRVTEVDVASLRSGADAPAP